jgi:hypothetical protein
VAPLGELLEGFRKGAVEKRGVVIHFGVVTF